MLVYRQHNISCETLYTGPNWIKHGREGHDSSKRLSLVTALANDWVWDARCCRFACMPDESFCQAGVEYECGKHMHSPNITGQYCVSGRLVAFLP